MFIHIEILYCSCKQNAELKTFKVLEVGHSGSTYNHSTGGVEAGRSGVQGQP